MCVWCSSPLYCFIMDELEKKKNRRCCTCVCVLFFLAGLALPRTCSSLCLTYIYIYIFALFCFRVVSCACVCVFVCVGKSCDGENRGTFHYCLLVSYLLLLVVVLYGFLFPSCFLSFFFFFFGSVCGRVFFCLSVNQSCYETTHHVIEHKTCFCFCKNWASLDCVCVCARIPQQYVRSIKFFAAMVPHSRNCGKRTRTSPGAAHCKKKSLMLLKEKRQLFAAPLVLPVVKGKKKRTLLLLPVCVTPIFSCRQEEKKGCSGV